MLQYWVFYEDNFWSLQYPPSDLVWRRRGRLGGRDPRPRRGAAAGRGRYSQHCTGSGPWATVPKRPATTRSRSWPPAPREPSSRPEPTRSPGVHPRGPFARSVVPLDVNAPGRRAGRPPSSGCTTTPRAMRFPGTWGETQYVHSPPIGKSRGRRRSRPSTATGSTRWHDCWVPGGWGEPRPSRGRAHRCRGSRLAQGRGTPVGSTPRRGPRHAAGSRRPSPRTTAPAPTNASSPISTAGQRIAPPPTRAPRRIVGPSPARGAAPVRPMKLSFVVTTRAMKTSPRASSTR